MVKADLLLAALYRVKLAEDVITTDMASSGIPDPVVKVGLGIHGELMCTLHSSAKVFAYWQARTRRHHTVTVIYGHHVAEAIGRAEAFIRTRGSKRHDRI